MFDHENELEPSSSGSNSSTCCGVLVDRLSSENARLKEKDDQWEANFSQVLNIIDGGKTRGLGHVSVDRYYEDDNYTMTLDSYDDYDEDYECDVRKKKIRVCMGKGEIRTVLKFLNAGVKRVHFCLEDFTELCEQGREIFEMEVEEGDWKIMIEISDNHEKDRFRLKLEQKNRTSNDGPMKFHASATHVKHPTCFHRRCGKQYPAFNGFSYQDSDGKETCLIEKYDDGIYAYEYSFFHINLEIIEEHEYRDVREIGTGYW